MPRAASQAAAAAARRPFAPPPRPAAHLCIEAVALRHQALVKVGDAGQPRHVELGAGGEGRLSKSSAACAAQRVQRALLSAARAGHRSGSGRCPLTSFSWNTYMSATATPTTPPAWVSEQTAEKTFSGLLLVVGAARRACLLPVPTPLLARSLPHTGAWTARPGGPCWASWPPFKPAARQGGDRARGKQSSS